MTGVRHVPGPGSGRHHDWRTPTVVLVASGAIVALSMGVRHGFGLFLQPMSADLHWGRETFALAMAVQNLMWGAATPFAGMFADRFGSHRVAFVCALLYVAGLVTMAHATTPVTLVLTAGVLIGAGLAGLSFSIVAGVLGRKYPPEKRSIDPQHPDDGSRRDLPPDDHGLRRVHGGDLQDRPTLVGGDLADGLRHHGRAVRPDSRLPQSVEGTPEVEEDAPEKGDVEAAEVRRQRVDVAVDGPGA